MPSSVYRKPVEREKADPIFNTVRLQLFLKESKKQGKKAIVSKPLKTSRVSIGSYCATFFFQTPMSGRSKYCNPSQGLQALPCVFRLDECLFVSQKFSSDRVPFNLGESICQALVRSLAMSCLVSTSSFSGRTFSPRLRATVSPASLHLHILFETDDT